MLFMSLVLHTCIQYTHVDPLLNLLWYSYYSTCIYLSPLYVCIHLYFHFSFIIVNPLKTRRMSCETILQRTILGIFRKQHLNGRLKIEKNKNNNQSLFMIPNPLGQYKIIHTQDYFLRGGL